MSSAVDAVVCVFGSFRLAPAEKAPPASSPVRMAQRISSSSSMAAKWRAMPSLKSAPHALRDWGRLSVTMPTWPRFSKETGMARLLAQHGRRDARKLRAHLRFRLDGGRPHDDAVGAGIQQAPDEIAIRRLAVHGDGDAGRIAPGVLGEPVERGAALAQLIGRDAIGQPAVAPGHHALEHIPGATAQDDWWMRLLRGLRVRADRREVVVLAVKLRVGLGPQLLH